MDPVTAALVGWAMILVILLGGAYVILMTFGVKVVLPKRKPRAEVDPWAAWKASKAELDRARATEHGGWQEDFDLLLRATCVHSYPATHSKPTYYTCYKCRYVEPWEFVENGCGCHFESHKSLTSPFPEYTVTYRHGNCKWHGIDYENFGKRSDRSNKPFKSSKELYK